jgi:hypothetical protein
MSLFWKILVFDEGTESTDIATNENILLLDEYSKVKLFEYLLHWRFPKVVPMGAIVIRTRYDEGTESAEVATSVDGMFHSILHFVYHVIVFNFYLRKIVLHEVGDWGIIFKRELIW